MYMLQTASHDNFGHQNGQDLASGKAWARAPSNLSEQTISMKAAAIGYGYMLYLARKGRLVHRVGYDAAELWKTGYLSAEAG